MSSVTLNGHLYDSSQFQGYGYNQVDPQTNMIRFPDGIFTDLLAQLSSAASIQSLSPGAGGNIAMSDGSNWRRSNDITSTVALLGILALGTNPSQSGPLRLPNNSYVTARNAANSADLNVWKIDGSNVLQLYNGAASLTSAGVLTTTTLAGTLSTAAQPNVTSVGTLTIVATTGTITSTNTADVNIITSNGTHASYSSVLFKALTTRAASAAFQFFVGATNGGNQFILDGTGTITLGVWNAGAVTSSGALTGTTGAFSGDVTITRNTDGGLILDAGSGGQARIRYKVGATSKYSVGYRDASGNFIIASGGDLNTTPLVTLNGTDFILAIKPQYATGNGTGSGAALLGANSPSAHLSAPYTWVDCTAADGTACTTPIWQK